MTVASRLLQYAQNGKLKFPELSSRIDRAAGIVRRGGYVRVSDTTWLIPSSEGTIGYVVNDSCTCPDFTGIDPRSGDVARPGNRAPRGWCKHRLAMLMLVKLISDTEAA